MNTKAHYFPLVILIIFVLIYGCVSSPTAVLPSNAITSPATALSTVSPYPTQVPTATPTRLSTKIPPPAPSGLPATWTPLPTYSSEQARQTVIDLYKNNPCTLPCWWGITPGKTSWLEAWQFLGRFATNRYPGDMLLLESKNSRGYMNFQVHLDLPQASKDKLRLFENYLSFGINIKSFIVDYINVDTGSIEAYTLQRILSDYGKPQEIYAMGGETPINSGVTLFLFYPEKGILSAQFVDVDRNVWKKPTAKVCFQKITASLSLWPPEQQLDFDSRMRMGNVDSLSLSMIKPINEVSDLNVDQFYSSSVDTQQLTCAEFNVDALLR